ncbi:potassium transporter Kup [Micromonospora sp. 067-2]|uniref:potassium transporter Kup n=1 Tax=Micromonospora sp. 067-2 TaxID=2789270 RepID=UPI003978CCD2
MPEASTGPQATSGHDVIRAALVVAALGVVFGDIGTSPIYTMQTVFNPADPHPVPVSANNVFGVASLVFWSVMLIVTLTYVTLAMRLSNEGEGGIMALITLLRRGSTGGRGRTVAALTGAGLFGAALFLGDSMITPAISVLSAVEGLKVIEPSAENLVIPITVVIIVLLFAVQRRGTATVGRLFGPVMILWFVTIGLCGAAGIARRPEILRALSPTYAIGFLANHLHIAFFALAAIVLAVTGAEALYADMGHFGRRVITRGWLTLVLPACALSYLGQAALILAEPDAISSPFFLLAPDWARAPLVVLATAATVIASQAVITGAFSVSAQAARLGYLPRLRIMHTSASTIGQIYVPWINWLLMVSVLTLIFAFRSSTALAFAFGMAVITTITITTLLFFYLARVRSGTPLWLVVPGAAVLLSIDLLFVGANLTKLVHGAWLPLLIGVTAFTVMSTWQRGRTVVTSQRDRAEGHLRSFIDDLHSGRLAHTRVPGTSIFLNRNKRTTPLALRANVRHNRVLHHQVLIMSVETLPVPYVSDDRRIEVDGLGHAQDGIVHVTVRFGYLQRPNIPNVVSLLKATQSEGPVQVDNASYFLSKVEVSVGSAPTMARWRKHLFVATSHITADAAEQFALPGDRTITIGSQIEI